MNVIMIVNIHCVLHFLFLYIIPNVIEPRMPIGRMLEVAPGLNVIQMTFFFAIGSARERMIISGCATIRGSCCSRKEWC